MDHLSCGDATENFSDVVKDHSLNRTSGLIGQSETENTKSTKLNQSKLN